MERPLISRRLYLVDHKFLDTDAVCAAIAYAHLLGATGSEVAVAARQGELRRETGYLSSPLPAIRDAIAGRGTGNGKDVLDIQDGDQNGRRSPGVFLRTGVAHR